MTDKGSILVVDDNQTLRDMLMETLIIEGYQARPAANGETALATVAASPPDLILLDIRMPGLDGLEVMRQLKSREESRDIPVIFLSAITQTGQRVEGLKLGAVDFISKPYQPEELIARLKTQMELRRTRMQLEKQLIDLKLMNDRMLDALAKVKQLSGMLPICASCKKIRDDKGYWSRIEAYIVEHSEVSFSHGICPDCEKKEYEELEKLKNKITRNA